LLDVRDALLDRAPAGTPSAPVAATEVGDQRNVDARARIVGQLVVVTERVAVPLVGFPQLDWVSDAGYAGIDLGPVGYLGTTDTLAGRLRDRDLALAGGYLELPFSEPQRLPDELPELDALLDIFDSAPSAAAPPRPTLADAGSPVRSRYPGRAALDPAVGLDAAGWKRFADGLARAADRCRERGYEPTFHHHTATYVEAQWEIEKLLEISDIGLCLDTGHLLLGRGEPIKAIRDWAERINQVHLKDARISRLEEIVAEAAPVQEIWRRRAFCALGDGDIDIEAVLEELQRWPDGDSTPGLDTGLGVQAVCEAIEIAAAERRWVDLAEVTQRRVL
jgi:inosose dehydratase